MVWYHPTDPSTAFLYVLHIKSSRQLYTIICFHFFCFLIIRCYSTIIYWLIFYDCIAEPAYLLADFSELVLDDSWILLSRYSWILIKYCHKLVVIFNSAFVFLISPLSAITKYTFISFSSTPFVFLCPTSTLHTSDLPITWLVLSCNIWIDLFTFVKTEFVRFMHLQFSDFSPCLPS